LDIVGAGRTSANEVADPVEETEAAVNNAASARVKWRDTGSRKRVRGQGRIGGDFAAAIRA
jgi:hypothetical protein